MNRAIIAPVGKTRRRTFAGCHPKEKPTCVKKVVSGLARHLFVA